MIDLRAKTTGEAHCPFCREDLRSGLAHYACSGCQVVYHQACARELPSCATLGCQERLQPPLAAPKRGELGGDLALQPASEEEALQTCRGCLQEVRGPQHGCPECDAAYHTACAYEERSCRRCHARLFPVRRRSPGEWSLDLVDSVMERAVGLAAGVGIAGAIGIMAYFLTHLSSTALKENQLLLFFLPPAIVGVSLGAAMLAKRAWRNHYREIRRRAPR